MIKDTNTSIRNHLFSFVTFICLITQIIGFQDTVPKQLVRPTRSLSKCRRRKKFGEFTGNS